MRPERQSGQNNFLFYTNRVKPDSHKFNSISAQAKMFPNTELIILNLPVSYCRPDFAHEKRFCMNIELRHILVSAHAIYRASWIMGGIISNGNEPVCDKYDDASNDENRCCLFLHYTFPCVIIIKTDKVSLPRPPLSAAPSQCQVMRH
jgi:hypothetical protein